MLRATNKETGTGLTDRHVVAQSNSFVIAGELPVMYDFHPTASAIALSACSTTNQVLHITLTALHHWALCSS